MKVYVSEDHRDWDELVPHITFCINTAKQETTKYTPFELVYGRTFMSPQDQELGYSGLDLVEDPTEYITRVQGWINKAREAAKISINTTHIKEANRYNARHANISYNPGDKVWLWSPPGQRHLGKASAAGLTTKLLFNWHGPWTIVRVISPVNYQIERPEKKKIISKVVHVRRLKKCILRTTGTDDDWVDQSKTVVIKNNLNESDSEVSESGRETSPSRRPARVVRRPVRYDC